MPPVTKTTSPSFILVVITAVGCQACNAFKENWPSIKRQLEQNISIVEIQQPSVTNQFDSKYPQGLSNFVKWFPTLILFDKQEWTSGRVSRGEVFNGEIVGGNVQQQKNSSLALNGTNIKNWLQTKIGLRF
jgi:hypothetical protein